MVGLRNICINTLHKGDDDDDDDNDDDYYDDDDDDDKLQLGCHPVAVVILHIYKIWNWLLINLSREGYMRRM